MTDQLDLDAIEARAINKHLTPGPWRVEQESCDCGGDYPCGHGMYVTGVSAPTPTEIALDRCKRTGEQPRDYDFHRSEIGDFTAADWDLMVHAREDVPALVAEVRRLRTELEQERTNYEAYRIGAEGAKRMLANRVNAVTELCDEQAMAARMFELPEPEWIGVVRQAVEHGKPQAATPAP